MTKIKNKVENNIQECPKYDRIIYRIKGDCNVRFW